MQNMNEKIQVGYAFNPAAILSLSDDKLSNMTEDELKKYFEFLMSDFDKNNDIDSIPEINGRIISNGEEWN